jgi:PGF-CTERM protein
MSRSLVGLMGLVLVVAAVGPAAVGTAAADDVTLTVSVETRAGSDVSGADLTATWDGGSTTETTRANGQALVDVPAGAHVTIEVDHDQYVRNDPVTVSNAQTRDVRIEVAPRGQATITVQSSDGPVAGASVRFIRDGQNVVTVQTDDDGVARSGAIEQGLYTVAISKAGFQQERLSVNVDDDTTRSISLQRGRAQVTITAQDDHFSPPETLENATIAIEPIGVSLVTLNDGEAQTTLPINSNFDLTVSKPGYESTTRNLPVGRSDTSLTVSINREPSLTLETASRRIVVGEPVRVTAIDEYGDPISDLGLGVNGTIIARTGPDGEADVPVESAGNVTITASTDGAEDSLTVEGVRPGGTQATTGNGTTQTEGGNGPGFGPLVALLGVAIGAALLARRR